MASPFLWRKRTARPWSSRMRRNVCWAVVLGVRYGRPETGLNGITFTRAVRRPSSSPSSSGMLGPVVEVGQQHVFEGYLPPREFEVVVGLRQDRRRARFSR